MATIQALRCPLCGGEYALTEVQYTCPACGEVGTLDVLYDYAVLRATVDRDALSASREASMWRYRALLPLGDGAVVPPLRVGGTPLYDAPRLAEALGLRAVWVKDDGQNPTASLKDRASALVVARALEQGVQVVSTASTGNAAAALAGVSASVGMQPIIFVPHTAPEAKIAQLLIYGAIVLLVRASYDVAFDLCTQMCLAEGWYCRNTGMNPFTAEGKKTVAFEIAEGLNWNIPDVLVVSVGDGNIIGGVHKGFVDLFHLGWIERIPRLIGVQAADSQPLVTAWEQQLTPQQMQSVDAQSIADSIVAGLPRDRTKALRAARETQGAMIAVTDGEILQAMPELARLTGVFAEPAAAASFAGLKRAVQSNVIQPDESVVLLITGSGLKDIKRAQTAVAGGIAVDPDLDAIRDALNAHLKKQ